MEIRVRRVLLADAGAHVQIQQPLERPAQLVDGRVQLQKAVFRREQQNDPPRAAKAPARILPREKFLRRTERCLAGLRVRVRA